MTRTGRRPLVAGNWKMNGTRASIPTVEAIRDGLSPELSESIDVLICPPSTLIGSCVAAAYDSTIAIGGQNLHARESGAFTGSISAEMLADLGATYVIVGHSERRAYHNETDDGVHAKALGARRAGLCGIICVGETIEEREQGRALDIVRAQLAIGLPKGATARDTVIAYEPVWAIGTGRTPSLHAIAVIHALIRARLADLLGAEKATPVRVLYGGSVTGRNARGILALDDVDGALVGGASLTAAAFVPIIEAAG